MDVFLCTINGRGTAYERLRKRIEDVVPLGDFRIGHSIRDLIEEFKRPSDRYRIVVLIAKSIGELEKYLSQKELIDDVPIILVLPDLEKQTLEKGYPLYPRYTINIESDFKVLASVLTKMLRHLHSKYAMLKGM